MQSFRTIQAALRTLRRSPLRSLLTTLGIILGVASVIIIIGLGAGARKQIAEIIARLDNDLITANSVERLYFRSPDRNMTYLNKVPQLVLDDYEAVRREVGGIAAMTPELNGHADARSTGSNVGIEVKGGSTDYLVLEGHELLSGVMFDEVDVRRAERVCVVSQDLAEKMFPVDDPVGRLLLLNGVPFTVLGVFISKASPYARPDSTGIAVVPYTSFERRVQVLQEKSGGYSTITVRAADRGNREAVRLAIDDVMQRRRGNRVAEMQVIIGTPMSESLAAQEESGQVMRILLASIGSVSLIVGGIGIMNIMLVSVTERTREIGLRLAVGGRGRDILRQFLTEAVMLSLVGGVLGILLGVGGIWSLANLESIPTLGRMVGAMGAAKFKPIVSSEAVIVAFFSCVAIGVFFGWYPARKAAQLDPIEALRHE